MFKFFLVAALIVCVVADSKDHHGESEDHHAETKLWKTEIGHHGWHSEFETTNHIRQAAHGDEHGNIKGDFAWEDPHGEKVEIHYVADEHGYQPEGDAIPKIPEAILKSLEYNKAHPYHEEEEHHDHDHHDHHHHH